MDENFEQSGPKIRPEIRNDDARQAKVLEAVASVKRLPRDQVSIESSLAELGYDSLDTINLLFQIEEEFKVAVPDDDARQIRTVREVVNGVEKLLAERTANSSAA